MSQTSITLADFTPDHLAGALDLSQAEHWPHRTEDWAMFLRLSAGAVALADGKVAATALLTRFGQVGLVNMIIVGHALRGRGLGRKLVQAAMDTADLPEYRLIATQAGLPLYRKMGFIDTGEVVQHQGHVAPVVVSDAVTWATTTDCAAIAALDHRATGMDRTPLIALIHDMGRIATLRDGDTIIGFAGIRPFGRGLVAGPVIAPDHDAARHLLSAVMADQQGEFIRVDTQTDSGLAPWLTGIGLHPVGGGIAMSTAPAAHVSSPRSFALAAQALG